MKRLATIALSVAATFLFTGISWAQDHAVKVTVPFNFTVNNTYLPAGHYTITSDLENPARLVIRDDANIIRAMGVGINDASETGEARILLFHEYGHRFFLNQVRFASPSQAIFFPATKLEQRVREQTSDQTVASVSAE